MKLKYETSLRLRLALLFGAVSAILFALIGAYVYSALNKEISHRDDLALLGRIDRMQALIGDSRNIDTLRKNPLLYSNMLGNKDNILWVINQNGDVLIEINPAKLSVPQIQAQAKPGLFNSTDEKAARLAWMKVPYESGSLTLIAGKLLAERAQIMATYRRDLGLAWLVGVILAFALGWEVVRRGLLPLQHLSQQAAAIDTEHLSLRLNVLQQPLELQALSAALNLMLARLEQGYIRLSQFSEDLAHEMRTPLNNLMSQTQWALNQPRTIAEYENLLVSQQEEYERLARMIDNMLFLARAENSELALTLVRLDVGLLAEQLCEYFEGVAQEKNMLIHNDAKGMLTVDSELVRRALANLIANAIRYGFPNTVIALQTRMHKEWMDIKVTNQGAPISSEHLPRLFDRFYRCETSRADPTDSGGLGLAIVQSIMSMHKGKVTVTSSDMGTTFNLRFPIVETSAHT